MHYWSRSHITVVKKKKNTDHNSCSFNTCLLDTSEKYSEKFTNNSSFHSSSLYIFLNFHLKNVRVLAISKNNEILKKQ